MRLLQYPRLSWATLVALLFLLAAPALASPYTDNGDGTVTDSAAGLTWMRCSMGQTWTGSTCTGTAGGYTWDQARVLTATFAGKSDWRLPSIVELNSIVEREGLNPAINATMFPNTPVSRFWSASPHAYFLDYAWIVAFGDGLVGNFFKSYALQVRLVRAEQSFDPLASYTRNADFIDNADGTVTHRKTGLMWKRCAEGQVWTGSTCPGAGTTYDWNTAVALSFSGAGYKDWRVPTANELSTIVEYQTLNPAINTTIFPNTTSALLFWSASALAGSSDHAWVVNFYGGSVGSSAKSDAYQLRLVRAGPSFGTFGLSVGKTGTGTVSSYPAGINCGSTCSANYNGGMAVVLTALPDTGSSFSGWGGACSGTGTCSVNMDAAKSVTATFSSNSPVLNSIAISCPSSLNEGTSATSACTATVTYSDSSTRPVTPTWSSSNSPIATISNSGTISAGLVAADTAVTISASYTEGEVTRSASASVTVTDVPAVVTLSSLAISGGATQLSGGSSFTLDATASYSDGSSKSVRPSWTSSNASAATVSTSGQVTAGTVLNNTAVTITASYAEGGVTRAPTLNFTVTPSPAARVVSISIQGSQSVPEGGTTTLKVVANYSDGSTQFVSANWSSSNSSLVSVSASGALNVGQVNADTTVALTATYAESGVTVNPKTFTLTVKDVAIALSYVTISGASSVAEGQTVTLTASAYYTDGSSKTVVPSWSSSNSSVATVSPSGAVTAAQVTGTTTVVISATYAETGVSKSYSTILTVKDVAAPTVSTTPALGIGLGHSIALRSDGSIWSWGWSVFGQSGTGDSKTRSTPVQVSGINAITGIGIGPWHNLALRSDGTVWAWGKNARGGLGDGTTNDQLTPVPVTGISGVKALAAGLDHSLALKTDGTVMAWGSNSNGQLGDGTNANLRLSPVLVSGLSAVTNIAANQYRSVALKSDGTVWGWGDLGSGPLYSPIRIAQISGARALAAGWNHTLVMKDDGTVWAWGDNEQGQLGDGTQTNRSAPVRAIGLTDVIAVAAGITHSVAVKKDGSVWAWGGNAQGQQGNGNANVQLTPQTVANFGSSVSVSAGFNYTIVLKSDGTVWGTGDNWLGQLGDGSFIGSNRFAPVQDADQAKLFDLAPNQATKAPVPADQVPVFYMKSEKSGDEVLTALGSVSSMSLVSKIPTKGNGFSATYQMFVAIFVPGGRPGLAPNGSRAAPVAADTLFCKIETTGWQPCGTEVTPYRANVNASGVGDIALSVLESTDLSGMSGAQFYVGYGTSAGEMLAAGRYRVMYRVP